jgi:large subunit ribosomal protein L28
LELPAASAAAFTFLEISAIVRLRLLCPRTGNFDGPWAWFEGWIDMSRTCDICGKHTVTGNKVSHAKNRTRRTWKPNLIKVKTEIGGTALTLKICARCLKSDIITKKV